jgi:hypothetical protein
MLVHFTQKATTYDYMSNVKVNEAAVQQIYEWIRSGYFGIQLLNNVMETYKLNRRSAFENIRLAKMLGVDVLESVDGKNDSLQNIKTIQQRAMMNGELKTALLAQKQIDQLQGRQLEQIQISNETAEKTYFTHVWQMEFRGPRPDKDLYLKVTPGTDDKHLYTEVEIRKLYPVEFPKGTGAWKADSNQIIMDEPTGNPEFDKDHVFISLYKRPSTT